MDSQKLCSRCRRIDLARQGLVARWIWRDVYRPGGTHAGDKVYIHSTTFAALEKSVATGRACVMCRIIVTGLLRNRVEAALTEKDRAGLVAGSKPDGEWPVFIAFSHISNAMWTSLRVQSGLYMFQLQEVRLFGELERFTNRIQDPLNNTTGSRRSLAQVKSWLDTCLSDHATCARYCSTEIPVLPTRVIDVGPAASYQDPVLVTTNGRRDQYVALSHCWGAQMRLATTSANIFQHQKGITLQTLPQNFLDAVTVTKALDCRYLWIDALCIIQDNSEDWNAESARMQDAYRNALVTISAARAGDSEDGCFDARDPLLVRPTALKVTGCRVGRNEVTGESFWSLVPDWRRTKADYPASLHRRAWVFQEQALSGRTVAYYAGTVVWHCLCASYSEEDPSGLRQSNDAGQYSDLYTRFQDLIMAPSSLASSSAGPSPDSDSRRTVRRPPVVYKSSDHRRDSWLLPRSDAAEAYEIWYRILRRYSSRAITYGVDKLPAISAVAAHVGRLTGDVYVAGLWRQHMVEGLLWKPRVIFLNNGSEKRPRRFRPPCPFVAPSWSWASVPGEVDWTWRNPGWPKITSLDATIIDVKCTPVGTSAFGRVSDGTIRMKGYVKTAVIEGREHLFDPGLGKHFLLRFEPDEDISHRDTGRVVTCFLMTRRWHWEERMQRDIDERASDYLDGADWTTYLVLLPTGMRGNEYRRTGLARTDLSGLGTDGLPHWSGTELKEILLV